jgi:hypothetical protein
MGQVLSVIFGAKKSFEDDRDAAKRHSGRKERGGAKI